MSINEEQKSLPSVVSTSWVMIAQLDIPSGQNQIKGISVLFCALSANNKSRSAVFSTVRSTGQLGKVS
jgi:hypothetical protein